MEFISQLLMQQKVVKECKGGIGLWHSFCQLCCKGTYSCKIRDMTKALLHVVAADRGPHKSQTANYSEPSKQSQVTA